MRAVILRVGLNGLGERLHGGIVAALFQGLQTFGAEVGGLHEEQQRSDGPHVPIVVAWARRLGMERDRKGVFVVSIYNECQNHRSVLGGKDSDWRAPLTWPSA